MDCNQHHRFTPFEPEEAIALDERAGYQAPPDTMTDLIKIFEKTDG